MNLASVKGYGKPRKARKRKGRGPGSGLGKTSGKGHKGQGQHTSGGRHKIGFEGGSMPLFRRIPKRGFSNAKFKKHYTIINVGDFEQFANGSDIDFVFIKEHGLVSPEGDKLKVLGNGKLTKKVTVTAHQFSASAKAKITQAGGEIKELGSNKQ